MAVRLLANAADNGPDENQRVEVAPNGRHCRVWDDSNDQEIAALRS